MSDEEITKLYERIGELEGVLSYAIFDLELTVGFLGKTAESRDIERLIGILTKYLEGVEVDGGS